MADKQQMVDAQTFLEDFARDIVAHAGNRPAIIAGWAKHLEARDQAVAAAAVNRASTGQSMNQEVEPGSAQVEERKLA